MVAVLCALRQVKKMSKWLNRAGTYARFPLVKNYSHLTAGVLDGTVCRKLAFPSLLARGLFEDSDASVTFEGGAIVMRACSSAWRLTMAADEICNVVCGGLLTLAAVQWSCKQAAQMDYSIIGCVVDLRGCVIGFGVDDVRCGDWHTMSSGGFDPKISKPWALLCMPDQVDTLMALAVESALHRMWRRVFTEPDEARQWVKDTAARLKAPPTN